jgi:hypothetical protein
MIHTWPDGRREIHHEGVSLPYTIPDEYPYPTPGEIVERSRSPRSWAARKGQGSSGRNAFCGWTPTRTTSQDRTVGRAAPSAVASRNDFVDSADRTRYFVRWVGQNAPARAALRGTIRGARNRALQGSLPGPLDARVAHPRGGGRAGTQVQRLRRGLQPEVYEDMVAGSAADQRPRPCSADTSSSVTTIPFRDTARGRPTAARESHRERTRPAKTPPRPRSSSGSARGPQGSPRSARRLRRP